QEVRRFTGHTQPVNGVAFAPDGQTVLTGSDDLTIRLWDRASGQELAQFLGYYSSVQAIAITADGHRILAAGGSTTARFWDRDYRLTMRSLCALLSRDLTPAE